MGEWRCDFRLEVSMSAKTVTFSAPEPGKWSTIAGSDRGIARYLTVTDTFPLKRESRVSPSPTSDNPPDAKPKAA